MLAWPVLRALPSPGTLMVPSDARVPCGCCSCATITGRRCLVQRSSQRQLRLSAASPGGSIPGYFMLKVENKLHAHAREMANQARDDDRERERRAVIGTARALHEWFGRVDLMLGVSLQTERWWSNESDVTLQPPSFDDQKAVLGHLPSYEAGVVATSMRAIELLLNTTPGMVARNSAGPEPRSLDETALAQFKSGQTAAQDGALALRSVAELPTPAKPES